METNRTWQLKVAESHLSDVVRRVREEGPQVITVDGDEAVVVMAKCEYDRLGKTPRTLVEVLRASPLRTEPPEVVDQLFGDLRYQPTETPLNLER